MSSLARKLISAGFGEPTDDDFNLVTGLYHFDGTNGGTNATFLDSSSNSLTIGLNGNTTQGSLNPFGSSRWSNRFNGQYLYIANQSTLTPGTSDFTIECWVYFSSSTTNQGIFQLDTYPLTGNTYIGPVLFTGGGAYAGRWGTMTKSGGNQSLYADSSLNPSTNTWYHTAVVRSSGTIKVYIDGAEAISFSDSTDYTDRDSIVIGAMFSTSYIMTGYISNFRYVKGTAVYTSAFTPPTTPLTNITNTQLFTCRSSGFIDNSSTGYTLTRSGDLTAEANQAATSTQFFSPFAPSASYSTANNGGSAYFDRTGDYLTAQNSDLAFGTGDFTVEGWVRFSPWSVATYSGRGVFHITTGYLNSTVYGPALGVDDSGNWHIYHVSGATALAYGPIGNEWYHFAWVRNSSTSTVYINGASVWSASDSNDYTWSHLVVGGYYSASYLLDGYISSFRIVKGTAVYTSAFTLPTSAPTAISGTELLLNFTNGAIFDNAMRGNVEVVGNAQLSTAQQKFGTTSLLLDGSGDYLFVTDNAAPRGYASWTIECWIYVAAHKNYNFIYAAGSSIQLGVGSDGRLGAWIADASGFIVNNLASTGDALSTTTWYHVALVRDYSASTVTWFIDGTASGQATSVTGNVAFTTSPAHCLGAYGDGTLPFDGYIDEFRITQKARYTSNFTAPTEEFANK